METTTGSIILFALHQAKKQGNTPTQTLPLQGGGRGGGAN